MSLSFKPHSQISTSFCRTITGTKTHTHNLIFLQACVCPQGDPVPACIAGDIPACLAAGLGGRGVWYPSMSCRFPGPHPHPRWMFRGIWSRPTAKGEVEGDLAGGGCLLWGVSVAGDACSGGGFRRPPCDSYCCRQYASYWNAFLFYIKFYSATLALNSFSCRVISLHVASGSSDTSILFFLFLLCN